MTTSAGAWRSMAKVLGRTMLEEVGTLFMPDTILRWYQQLIAKKWDRMS